jgi:hypothetical protein
MQIQWNFANDSIDKWQSFIDKNIDSEFVQDRYRRNIDRIITIPSTNEIWFAFVGCQVTTQQRSGPNTPVSKFLESSSPVLDYEKIRNNHSNINSTMIELSKFRLRRINIIAENLNSAILHLENDGWENLLSMLKLAIPDTNQEVERKIAEYISDKFKGIGLKQSRNWIQWLGISRYEIPIDSRTLRLLKQMNCDFVPDGGSLCDKNVYYLVQDGLQAVAKRLNISPCILDACIFSSFDA